jgi:glucan-binding YG repeat protein
VEAGGYTYYFTDYVRAKGFTKIGDDYYFFNAGSGTMYKDTNLWVGGDNQYGVASGSYYFQQDGTMFIPDLINGKKEIISKDGKLYFTIDGVTMKSGLYELDGEYYHAGSTGALAVSTTIWVSQDNDLLTNSNGYYAFDAEGKLIKTGFVTGGGYTYYYENAVRMKGFIKIGDDYYFLNASSGSMYKDKSMWVGGNNAYGIPSGSYYFGADGKMVTE